ncbi:MAG: PAS domain-containing protein [Chloroflexi bacterium]|nr:PAS domain-containing protein [Chloroflexota bacterium]
MAQKEIEIILTRQLASYLAMPIFIVDPQGSLVFYNEPAEAILGKRFEETGEMSQDEWVRLFAPSDGKGNAVALDRLPLAQVLANSRPANSNFWIRGMDSIARHIELFAFPLVGQTNRNLGAVAIFWETPA